MADPAPAPATKFDLTAFIAKVKELEAQAPGFLANLSAELNKATMPAWLTGVLGKVCPSVVGAEQDFLNDAKKVVNWLIAEEGAVFPFIDQAIAESQALLPYLDQVLALLKSMVPAQKAS